MLKSSWWCVDVDFQDVIKEYIYIYTYYIYWLIEQGSLWNAENDPLQRKQDWSWSLFSIEP